jgi:polyisoprenoid-binding protein YceI
MYGGEEHTVAEAGGLHPPERTRAAGTWVFDAVDSRVRFSVRRVVVSRVHGQFTKWRGRIAFDDTSLESSRVEVHIDAASIETDDADRDAHLRSADFLHADRFPHITFTSTKVESASQGRLRITGILAVRGVKREVVLDAVSRGRVPDRWGNPRLGFTAKITIQRHDFGLTWNAVMPTGELLVGEDIEISVDILATRAPSGTA